MALRSYFLGFFFILPLVLSAQDKPLLTWYKMDDPPDFFVSGPLKGQGVQDKVMKWFQDRLPGYRHGEEIVNFPRILQYMKEGRQGVSLGFFRSEERRSFMYFSEVPSGVFFPIRLVIPQKLASNPQFLAPVDFARLIRDPSLRGGLAQGRAYGDVVDKVLAEGGESSRLYVRGGDLFQGLYKMMIEGRVDYILGSPLEASLARNSLGGDILILPIQGEDVVSLGYAGYPKTAFGWKLQGEMEALLHKAWRDPEFVNLYQSLLDGESRKGLERVLKEEILP